MSDKKRKRDERPIFIAIKEDIIHDVEEYMDATPNYIVYSPSGINTKVESVGIDIGCKHLALTGTYLIDKKIKIGWICMISGLDQEIYTTTDFFCKLFATDSNFKWLRECKKIAIELQPSCNPKAVQISYAIRSCLVTLASVNDKFLILSFQHANFKFKVGPKLMTECKEHHKSIGNYNGTANYYKRKMLSVTDTMFLLKKYEDLNSIKFLEYLKKSDQIHDCTDSYLISLYRLLQ